MAVTLSSSTVTQLILVDASSGAVTVDLKTTGTRCPDVLHVIKKIDSSTYAVTIQDSGGSQIEGNSTFVLVKQNDTVTLALDGNTNTWRVVSNNSGLANGYVPYVSSGLLANSPVYTNGTNVLIGTISDNGCKLQVNGNIFGTQYLKLQAFPGYGSGNSEMYYDGNLNTFSLNNGLRVVRGNTYFNGDNVSIGALGDNGSKLQVNGSAWINGSFSSPIKTVTAAYTLTSSDSTVLANASSAAFTVTLPDATTCSGREYVIKKIDSSANAVTVGVTGTQTIDGASSRSLASQYKYITVQSDGSNWYIIANN